MPLFSAASAGEAGRLLGCGRGSATGGTFCDATRQISALVKAIQTDTQDAIGAMERSTQRCGGRSQASDNAGTALTEIDRVSAGWLT